MGSSSSRNGETLKWSNNSTWMSELPASLHNIPLTEIAIPGSHNSFTFDIKKSNGICKASLDEPLRRNIKLIKPAVRYFVFNWSITQSLTVIEQLENGIRYFDIRVAGKMEGGKKYIFGVHSMYSRRIIFYLEEMKSFLISKKKEVVFLDFNHCYDMTSDDHCGLIENMLELFGSMVCPVKELGDLSLNWVWENGFQVIIIYHFRCDPVNKYLWPNSSIRSEWPDKSSINDVIKFLNKEWERNRDYPVKFKVYQAVLTPSTGFIVRKCTKTLKQALTSVGTFKKFVQWIKSRTPQSEIQSKKSKNQANIFIADFVEFERFSDAVIRLNFE